MILRPIRTSGARFECGSAIQLLLCVVFFAFSAKLLGEQQTSCGEAQTPLLSLDHAVSPALMNNRLVKNSVLEAEMYDFGVNTIRSRRPPQFQVAVLGGELLHSFDFTFLPGVFGTFPGIGPVPAANSKIRTPAQFITHTTAGLDQPETRQHKIHFSIRATWARGRS